MIQIVRWSVLHDLNQKSQISSILLQNHVPIGITNSLSPKLELNTCWRYFSEYIDLSIRSFDRKDRPKSICLINLKNEKDKIIAFFKFIWNCLRIFFVEMLPTKFFYDSITMISICLTELNLNFIEWIKHYFKNKKLTILFDLDQ